MEPNTSYKLSSAIYRKSQIGELLREINEVKLNFEQSLIRDSQVRFDDHLLSSELKSIFEKNNIKITNLAELKIVEANLSLTFKNLKSVHFSFSQPASNDFLMKLIRYLRKEINPLIVLSVGLDPSIGIGTRLRTTNKYFDLSLATRLQSKRASLLNRIKESES